ncbi:hypothetical protein HYS30_01660 [Candidatus Peregrinibacteria bacterium]|nr:hypothetical protein [Candidatus Peregrinibacteria bacterium]
MTSAILLIAGTSRAENDEIRIRRTPEGDITVTPTGPISYVAATFVFSFSEGWKERNLFAVTLVAKGEPAQQVHVQSRSVRTAKVENIIVQATTLEAKKFLQRHQKWEFELTEGPDATPGEDIEIAGTLSWNGSGRVVFTEKDTKRVWKNIEKQ